MKIMYVTDQLYLHGGIEKILSQKMNYWINHYQYDVLLCTSEQKGRDFIYKVDNEVKHVDLKVNYHRNISYFHPKNLVKTVLHFKRMRKIVAKFNPDVIISINNTPEQYFVPFFSRKIKKVKEFHSSGVTLKSENGLIGTLKKKLFNIINKYDLKVVLNQDEATYYSFKGIEIIPNFIETVKSETPETREKVVIAAGRIAPVKQFDHLLIAWCKVTSDYPQWQLKIFGEGLKEYVDYLKDIISKNDIHNVSLAGATNDLYNEMRKASIYAMTSSSECFPMVLLEAQAAGLPVVSYNCPNGPSNIITSGKDGVLTPHNDIDKFAVTLKMLIESNELRQQMSEQARKSYKKYSQENIMDMWNKLLLRITAEN